MNVIASMPPSHSFLTVGHPLKLSLTLHDQKAMFGTTLLGWKEHAWLVCEWPAQLGHDADIPRGTPCTVSYLHDGKLVGYRTDIRDLVASPVPLLFLAFPHTVEEMHLREHTRVSSCEPALLMRMDNMPAGEPSVVIGGLIHDFSASGCCVAVRGPRGALRPGAQIRLEFGLPGIGHVTNLSGSVKNMSERQGHVLLGIEFRFNEMEYIEYRGWGGSVKQAIESCVLQKLVPTGHPCGSSAP